jgi:FKBP-type peptidyl-prolyl cis-trans isomerase FkpA
MKYRIFSLTIVLALILTLSSCKEKPKTSEVVIEDDQTTMVDSEDSTQQRTESLQIQVDTETNKPYYKILETGLKYHVHDYHPNQIYPNIGDVLVISMDYYLRDSILFSYKELSDTMRMRMQKPEVKGDINEALFQMHQFDSAEFIIDAKNFYLITRDLLQLPDYVKEGDSLRFHIRLNRIIRAENWKKEQANNLKEKRKTERSEIQRYIIQNGLKAEDLNYGVKRVIKSIGNGKTINTNSQVKIHYDAMFLDKNIFSSTKEGDEAFEFTLGTKSVIPGLEIGLTGLKAGSKALIIIPFDVAYGEENRGPIPPWSTLVFDVEVINVK